MNQNQMSAKPPSKLMFWFMIFFSSLILIGILFFLPSSSEPIAFGSLPVNYILFFMGLMTLVMSFVLPNLMKPEGPVEQAEITKYILSLALNESASLFGFIIAYVNADFTLGLILMGISTVGFLIKFPRAEARDGDKGSNTLNVD